MTETKKAYQPPTLVTYGPLEALTLGTGVGNCDFGHDHSDDANPTPGNPTNCHSA